MSRIFIAGLCPLPFENTERTYAPGLRTWQFARPLHEAGHEVLVVASRIPFVYPGNPGLTALRREERLTILQVDQDMFEDDKFLRRTLEEFAPDACIGATVYPSARLAS